MAGLLPAASHRRRMLERTSLSPSAPCDVDVWYADYDKIEVALEHSERKVPGRGGSSMIERSTRASLRRTAWLWQAGACFAVLLDVELARGESVQRPYVSLDATLLSLDSATVDSPSELDAEAGTDLEVDETTSTFGLLGSGVGLGVGVRGIGQRGSRRAAPDHVADREG